MGRLADNTGWAITIWAITIWAITICAYLCGCVSRLADNTGWAANQVLTILAITM